ncbi:MAG: DUF2062 domain-containing protein [Saprospiraceae bacterium]|nr:DUF2062 domain-containing protein [Lewinella sp.]
MKNRSRVAFSNPLRALQEVRDEPKEAAKGFALGVFFAMTPLVCIKVVLAIIFASIFKWNRASTTIGVLTANPLTVPFIFSTAYFVGASILGMDLDLDINTIFSQQGMTELFSESKGIILATSLGGTVVGLVAAPMAYYIAYLALKRRRSVQPALQPSPVPVD